MHRFGKDESMADMKASMEARGVESALQASPEVMLLLNDAFMNRMERILGKQART